VALNGSGEWSWGIMNWIGVEMAEIRNISSTAVFFITKSKQTIAQCSDNGTPHRRLLDFCTLCNIKCSKKSEHFARQMFNLTMADGSKNTLLFLDQIIHKSETTIYIYIYIYIYNYI
jgi:hypothetical protein